MGTYRLYIIIHLGGFFMRLFSFGKVVVAGVLTLTMIIGTMAGVALAPTEKVEAVNPIVQDRYTADPAPMVCSDGRLYVYTSHDEDVTVNGFFSMNDWSCFSTTDMVNWTDHGTVLSFREFEWAKENSSWACQCIERDGLFYLYVPINAKNGQTAIGVAVSDSPTGPFEDPLGEPLVGPAPNYIDPTVWIDTDGQAYLYWGNPDLFCVKLNDDMISYDDSLNSDGFVKGIKKWDLETADFSDLSDVTNANGQIADGSYADYVSEACAQAQAEFGVGVRVDDKNKVRRPTLYEEGPWFYGRNGHYYMIYAANGIPERIDYSMSDSPLGPWEYKGIILDENMDDGKGTGSFTNHPGIVDYKGHTYIFYHTGRLPGGGGYKRSVAVEELYYNEDGTIETIPMTGDGPEACDTLNPYQRVEAETMAEGKDIEKQCFYPDDPKDKDVYVTDIEDGDSILVKNVDFTEYGAVEFTAQTSSEVAEGETAGYIEVRLDSKDGELLCNYEVFGTGSYDMWYLVTVEIDKTKATGTHDLYLCFTGDEEKTNLFKFDYWQFTQDEIPATPVPVVTAAPVISPAPVNTATPAPKETTAPEIKAPAKAKINSVKSTGKGKVKVNIKRVKDAKGYRIKYSVNKSFKKAVKSIVIKKNTVTIKKLKSRKKYYFKAQAFVNDATGKKLYGKFSNTVKVKVR